MGLAIAKFSPTRFGEQLRAMRGSRTLDEIAEITGVPAHTIARFERGETAKPAFHDIVQLGKGYGLRPDQMAALAGLYMPDDRESAGVERAIDTLLDRVRNCYWDADPEDRRMLVEIVNSVVDVFRRRQAALPTLIAHDGQHEP